MPFIHIKSLSLDPHIHVSSVVEEITKGVARETGVGLEHITATWEYFQAGHYAVAESISKRAKVPITNIFINHRQAHSGMVFNTGEVETW